MGVLKNFLKSNTNKKNAPVESAPVVSRGGRIGRVSLKQQPVNHLSEEPEKKVVGYEESAREESVSISDSAFLKDAGKRTAGRKGKRRFYTVKNKEKHPFPMMTVIFCVICTALFMSMIVNLVEINEFTKDVADLQKQVETLGKQRTELAAELDEKDSIDALRQYMEEKGNTLGMVEEGKMNAPVAIAPDKTDKIEDYEVPEEEEAIVTVVLNALAKNLSDTWNKFVG